MDWSFIAGFFDADGSVSCSSTQCCLKFFNTNREVIQAIKDFISPYIKGNPSIYRRKTRPIHNTNYSTKDIYSWEISGRRDFIFVAEKLANLCIVKKKKLKKAIKIVKQRIEQEKNPLRYMHGNKHITPEILYDLSVNKKMTRQEIANHFGVNWGLINYRMKIWNIPINIITFRDEHGRFAKREEKRIINYIDKKNCERRFYANEYKEKLKKLYWDDGLSTREIANILNIRHSTVRSRMEKLGIPRRTRSEAIKMVYKRNQHR